MLKNLSVSTFLPLYNYGEQSIPKHVPLSEANENQLISFASQPRSTFNMDEDHIHTWEGLKNLIWCSKHIGVDTVDEARKVLVGWVDYYKVSTLFVGDTYVFPGGTYEQRVEELRDEGEVIGLYGLSHYCIVYESLGRILYLQEQYSTEGSNVFTEEKDMGYYKGFFLGRVSIKDYKAYLKECRRSVDTVLNMFE